MPIHHGASMKVLVRSAKMSPSGRSCSRISKCSWATRRAAFQISSYIAHRFLAVARLHVRKGLAGNKRKFRDATKKGRTSGCLLISRPWSNLPTPKVMGAYRTSTIRSSNSLAEHHFAQAETQANLVAPRQGCPRLTRRAS